MENNLVSSHLQVCSVLNEHSAEYLLVGGTAVALHGYYRHSENTVGIISEKPDVDLWYNLTCGNYFKFQRAC